MKHFKAPTQPVCNSCRKSSTFCKGPTLSPVASFHTRTLPQGHITKTIWANTRRHTESVVESRNREDFLASSAFTKFLTGPGLAPLSPRLEENITKGISALASSQPWTQVRDLMGVLSLKQSFASHKFKKSRPTSRTPKAIAEIWLRRLGHPGSAVIEHLAQQTEGV
ncbi:hypothetical protein DM02DRAFT_658797 [Periconia macrospinosa]|uniref:GAG-pre-integrase domain-containing protein n=1 Tax=Periconia macrospinosa TaxID=97972 RepID=A0A2V1DFD4_9PLEO|nr:hypothetical protein DM02DRAFT_658797 [Periconia macrospinosa]